VDGVGTILRERSKRWAPAATRRCALIAMALVPQLALLPLLNLGPGHVVPAVIAGVASLVLLLTGGGLSRAAGDSVAGAFAALAALPFAAVAGVLAPLGKHPILAAGAPQLATAGAAMFAVAAIGASLVGVAVVPGEQKPPAGSPLLAGAMLAGVIGLAALGSMKWNAQGCAALAAAFTLSLTVLIPRIAYRSAGLPAAAISLNAADLRAQSAPLSTATLTGRSLTADRIVTALVAGSAMAVTVCVTFALRAPGWTPPVLGGVSVLLLALRARLFGGTAQRWWLIGAALVTALPTADTVAGRWHADDVGIGIVLGALLIATAVIGQIAVRPERRFAPTLARWGDLLELLGIMATVPLALLILGTFGYFRSLGG
jgi:type VII secretion integral membrane protein EccD